jgi:predicted DCC family thiol-disulfide oxidoreductase YuxK
MKDNEGIVLFDGVCNLCNQSVQFIIKRDPKNYFRFAALQSDQGQLLLEQYSIPVDVIDTIVLVENNKTYTQSTAALRIARKLNRLWFLLYIFILIPPFLRNPIYRFIARNRYKWFGKKDSCMMPDPELKSRFLP